MKSIVDNFSERAKTYAEFRPVYPQKLYDFIYTYLNNFETAWDAGTGNGQVAYQLSKNFYKVFATDISDSQLALAPLKSNIYYSNIRSEKTNFEDNYFDLITVGQAFHWLDQQTFLNEVKRVSKSNGILAVWGYNLIKVTTSLDNIVAYLHNEILGKYWHAERKIVDNNYKDILFLENELESQDFEINTHWTFKQLMGYLSSWSAVNQYQKVNKENPLDLIELELLQVWGNKETYPIKFPLFLRLGRIEK